MAEHIMVGLSKKTGKKESAHKLISESAKKAVMNHRSFVEILSENEEVRKYLSGPEIHDALKPSTYHGLTEKLIDKVLKSSKKCG